VHDFLVREVAVGEHDLVDPTRADERFKPGLGDDRDAFRIEGASERGRVTPIGDAGNLGGRER
jgi:hypothetical protein